MVEKKFCPFTDKDKCLESSCALYDADSGACGLLVIAKGLKRLGDCTSRGVFLVTKP